jgi:hypothetical protein
MKRFDKKIGIRTKEKGEDEVARKKVQKVIAVLLVLSLAGCQKAWHGRDGRPGDAYLALDWQVSEPVYIDAGTSNIPPVFYWGQNYMMFPGMYNLYYEGRVWTGMSWASYAWEVMYEIYEISGENGGWYYNGQDGPDNYFMIVCSPYGPNIQSTYKNAERERTQEIVLETEEEIVVKQLGDGVEMKITYKKVDPKMNNANEVE